MVKQNQLLRHSTYKVVKTIPKRVFITNRNENFEGIPNVNNAKELC